MEKGEGGRRRDLRRYGNCLFSPPPLYSLFPGSNERSPELKTDDGRLNREEGGREKTSITRRRRRRRIG